MTDSWPQTIFGVMPGTWASKDDYENYMFDLMRLGKASSVMKGDGKQYYVPMQDISPAEDDDAQPSQP